MQHVTLEQQRGDGAQRTQLDNVADDAHDDKADAYGLGDLEEFPLVGCEEG